VKDGPGQAKCYQHRPLKCPECGATTNVDRAATKYVCPNCRATVAISPEAQKQAVQNGQALSFVGLIVAIVVGIWVWNSCNSASSDLEDLNTQLNQVNSQIDSSARKICIDAGYTWNYTTDTCDYSP
jgi:predicted RNA-binding Zn-ribbon protein involved in translation (DUF1610 family)